MSYIDLQHIHFAYAEEEPLVFEDFSFSLEKGVCLMVEGDNGAGKSTLFRILNGLSFPQEGKFIFDGTEINRDYLKDNSNAKRFHKKIGFLFQNPDIMLFNANVYDEVAFGPRQMGLSDEEVDSRVQDLLKLFNLTSLAEKAPYHLSGGQKKRVALASVMALNPEVIILDEPLAGLDRKTQSWMINFLKELKKAGKTLIVATHNAALSEALADERLELIGKGEEET